MSKDVKEIAAHYDIMDNDRQSLNIQYSIRDIRFCNCLCEQAYLVQVWTSDLVETVCTLVH